MHKTTGLLALIVLAIVLGGCSFSMGMGADEPGKKWIALMEKHKKAFEEGKFDRAAFKAEAKPIADELRAKRDESNKKVQLSETVLADFKRTSDEFEKLLAERARKKM